MTCGDSGCGCVDRYYDDGSGGFREYVRCVIFTLATGRLDGADARYVGQRETRCTGKHKKVEE